MLTGGTQGGPSLLRASDTSGKFLNFDVQELPWLSGFNMVRGMERRQLRVRRGRDDVMFQSVAVGKKRRLRKSERNNKAGLHICARAMPFADSGE